MTDPPGANLGVLASTELHASLQKNLLRPHDHTTNPEAETLHLLPLGLQLVHRMLMAGARSSSPSSLRAFDVMLWYTLWMLHCMAIEAVRRNKLPQTPRDDGDVEPRGTKRPYHDNWWSESRTDFAAYSGRVTSLLRLVEPTLTELSQRDIALGEDTLLSPQWRTPTLANEVLNLLRAL